MRFQHAKNTISKYYNEKSGASMGQGEPSTLPPSAISPFCNIHTTVKELTKKELSLCEVSLTARHPRCMKSLGHMYWP